MPPATTRPAWGQDHSIRVSSSPSRPGRHRPGPAPQRLRAPRASCATSHHEPEQVFLYPGFKFSSITAANGLSFFPYNLPNEVPSLPCKPCNIARSTRTLAPRFRSLLLCLSEHPSPTLVFFLRRCALHLISFCVGVRQSLQRATHTYLPLPASFMGPEHTRAPHPRHPAPRPVPRSLLSNPGSRPHGHVMPCKRPQLGRLSSGSI
jgi:hypothetical protein